MRLAITFDTGASRYAWLTGHLFVAAGRQLGTGRIEYAVHRVAEGQDSGSQSPVRRTSRSMIGVWIRPGSIKIAPRRPNPPATLT
jgi:hypothetical protein